METHSTDFSPQEAAQTFVAELLSVAADELPITVSLFNNARDNSPQQRQMTWSQLRLKYFRDHDVRSNKDGQCFSPVSYRPDAKRANSGVKEIFCAVFDVEHHGTFESMKDRLDGFAFVAYSSFSHTVEEPRFRIVLPLAVPVSAEAWNGAWLRLNAWLGAVNDISTKDAARLYYLPSRPTNSCGHFIEVGDGAALRVEDLPEVYLPVDERSSKHSSPSSHAAIDGIEEIPQEISPAFGLARVVARCKFMGQISQPDEQKKVSRPLWRAMISNACRFAESDSWIHDASREYDGYSREQTQSEIDSCRSFPAPITCQRIRDDGYEGCPDGGCKTVAGNVTKAPAGLWMNALKPVDRNVRSTYRIGDFEVSDAGVKAVRHKDGDEYKVLISSRIEVLAQTVSSNKSHWGYLLSIRNPDGNDIEFCLPRQILANKQMLQAELLKRGASIYGDGVYSYLMACDDVAERAVTVSQPGWATDIEGEPIFVMPGQVVHRQSEEVKALLQEDDSEGRMVFARAGSLEEWKAHVAAPAAGNSRLTFAISVALTGPLLLLLQVEGGGFHLVGESSSGKTTAVEIAASVWGGPKFVQQWRATSNALESIASRHNDTLLVLDEINQIDAEEAGEIAYMLGNGRGKARATRDALAREVSTWRLMFLSTGEKSLSEHLQSGNGQIMAGQEVRMVSFPADAGRSLGVFEDLHTHSRPQAFADYFKDACKTVFGTAGVAWVQALLQSDPAEISAEIRSGVSAFEAANVPIEAAPQVRRVARKFALVGAVGEAAIRRGILPWREGEAVSGARACFSSWLADRGGLENQEERQALAQIRRYLEQYGESRFTAWDSFSDNNANSRTVNRVGFRQVADDGRTDYVVLPEAYKTELCAGLNAKAVTKVLRERNLLVLGNDSGNTRKERLPGLGSTRVYRIKADIFTADEG